MTEKKVIGITMGHPSGIGPEVVAKALCEKKISSRHRIVIFGDSGVMEQTATRIGIVRQYTEMLKSGVVGIVEVSALKEKDFQPGKPSESGSLAQVGYIREAVAWASDGRISSIATAPISKAGMISGGYNFPGHTELLAKLAGADIVAMMFSSTRLKVVLATIHVPIAEVASVLKADLILKRMRLAVRAMQLFYGKENPKIGVSALNPHGGEEGRIGREERLVIAPAIELAQGEGMAASGPFPADTLFCRALSGEFDLIMTMYHDQAMIPIKTLGFGKSVNITLGLPFIRTSPDHGTAFDLAPRCAADPSGMVNAIDAAARLSSKLTGVMEWTT